MPLQADGLADLLAATIRDLGEGKATDLSTDLQKFPAYRELMRKERVTLDSGTAIQWDVITDQNNQARWVGMYGTDSTDVQDTLIQGNAPWRHGEVSYAFDRREIAMNRSPRQIVDLVSVRRHTAQVSSAEKFEAAFWSFPASTDTTTPYGLAYWDVKNASEGFYGSAQSGYTTVGGISPTTYTRWRNWTYIYTAVSKSDLIRHWREAAVKTNFQPPVDGMKSFNTGDKYGYYTNYACLRALEEELEAQNENLGKDLASMDGETMFRRIPVKYVPKLDADTTNPVYGINWGVFKTHILRGQWMRETRIDVTPGKHCVATVWIDSTFNWICKDRRSLFVLATGTSYP